MKSHALILGLAVITVTSLATATEASETSMEVKVELTDQARPTKPVTIHLVLSGSEGCASVDDRNTQGELHVHVCRDGGEDERPVLSFSVERTLNLDEGTERRRFHVKSKLALGLRRLMGRFGEGSSAMELAATVRSISEGGPDRRSKSP